MIKVLVVDDSALVRKMLTTILESDPDIKVVATAQDPHVAREKIKNYAPDVLTLDVEMPRMDGITFLSNLMRLHPMPVVMVSSLTQKGADVTLEALALGAVDFVAKPKVDVAAGLDDYRQEIIYKVKMAASAQVRSASSSTYASNNFRHVKPKSYSFKTTDKIIAIGASTGGTEAIREVLQAFPPDAPGVLVAQHIPEMFSARFAERLNQCCEIRVKEAQDGDQVLSGHAYIAPGNAHLVLRKDGARYVCELSNAERVNRHRPSVDVLFESVARTCGQNSLGVILTGMGGDGAKGLLAMKHSGALTFAQDEQSSVVWGMPGEAVKLQAVDKVLNLARVGSAILSHFEE